MTKINKEISKKIKSFILAGTIAGSTMATTACNPQENKTVPADESSISITIPDYLNDYGSINGEFNDNFEKILDGQKFSFIKITDNIIPEDLLTKYQNEHLGLLFEYTHIDNNTIYNSIEIAKQIITQHQIDCPVLLNIDNYLSLTVDYSACFHAREFIYILSNNKIYAGIYGTEESIDKINEISNKYFKDFTNNFDCLIKTQESINSINTQEEGSMIELSDGPILWKQNITSIIEEYNLNNPNKFIPNLSYTVKDGDTLSEIAEKFGTDAYTIMNINNLQNVDLYIGQTLELPQIYNIPEYTSIDYFKNYQTQKTK